MIPIEYFVPQKQFCNNSLQMWAWPYASTNQVNTLRPRQNGRQFLDDIFKRIFLNENVWISLKISLKFVPKGLINNIPALFQIMAWRWPGDMPLSEPIMVNLLTHICVPRPQWANHHNAWNQKMYQNWYIFLFAHIVSILALQIIYIYD